MRKTLAVAWREFVATVATRGFVIGVFLPPALMIAAIALMPILMNQASPRVTGSVALIDHTGVVAPRLEQSFTAEAIKARRDERNQRHVEGASKVMPIDPAQQQAAVAAASAAAGSTTLRLEVLPPESDVEEAKKPIATADAKGDGGGGTNRLALAVLPAASVTAGGDGFGGYDLFVAPKLDPEVQGDIREQIERAVVEARVEAAGLDPAQVRAMMQRPSAQTLTVTLTGEQSANQFAAIFVPVGFMMLLWISVFTGGQYLLTSTVEEKSSRVMEVLLSAVSPMELMVGKILGQMAVAGVILAVYAVAGVGSLAAFEMAHLLDPVSLVYLVVFFVIAFFLIAAIMAAIGSAVNDMREAQALLGPIMIVLIIPLMLWLPISRNPNSVFALVCSFLPPISPFVMVIRMAGSEKIPAWQPPVAVLVGLVAALGAAWAAAKIFRVGVLMFGKAPDLKTLVRWVRMA